jgi:hypothetical protein
VQASTLLDRINYCLRGLDDETPTIGTPEADLWLSFANQKIEDLVFDPYENWSCFWELRSLATPVGALDNTYSLDADFVRASDYIIVTDTSGNEHRIKLVEPELRVGANEAYISGNNPQVLNFNGQIIAGSVLVGGTITVPGYYKPSELTLGTDVVPVDNPNWLAYAVASEVAFNDTSYEDKAPDLLAKANDLYKKMRLMNKKGSAVTPRKTTVTVNRIRGVN